MSIWRSPRLNDVIAAAALVLLLPLLLLIAIVIKLTSRGPILYAQVRIGVDHRFAANRRARLERTGTARIAAAALDRGNQFRARERNAP